MLALHLGEQGQPVLVGEQDVDHDQVRAGLADRREGLGSALCLDDLVALTGEEIVEEGEHVTVIVDDENGPGSL